MIAFFAGLFVGGALGYFVGAILAVGKAAAADFDFEEKPGLEDFIQRRIDAAVQAERERLGGGKLD